MIQVVTYETKYKEQLEVLLKDLSQELFQEGTANIDEFVNNHWVIYLALKGDEVIGLSSFFYNTYYGLRTPTVCNTYLYVKPEYRRGRASYLLSIQAGYVSIDTNLPLETYYASDDSRALSKRMTGTHQYDSWIYQPEDMREAYIKHTRNFKLRTDK